MATALEFFQTLYAGIGAGWIEIRPLLDDEDPRRSTDQGKQLQYAARRWFTWPKDAKKAAQYAASISGKDFHVYFGVALRKNEKGGAKDDVGCATAAFADIDFKDVSREEVHKILAAFPFKPSIAIKSGNGVHLYWLLKDPVFKSGFARLEQVNLALLLLCQAQRGPQDVSRILRVPGTANIKPKYGTPHPTAEVSWWQPDLRHSLEEIAHALNVPELGQVPQVPATVPPGKIGPPDQASSQKTPPTQQPGRPVPSRELGPELTQRLAELLTGIWFNGHRHQLSMYIAGILAHAGYLETSALRLVSAVCQLANDAEAQDRDRAVRDTYQKHLAGLPVAGAPTLEKMIDEFPGILKEKARKIYEIVRKSIPKDEKKSLDDNGPAPNFELKKVIKFDSRPARYTAIVTKDETDWEIPCDSDTLQNFYAFRRSFFEHTPNLMLPKIKDWRWEKMLAEAPREIREAPKEARPEGAIETALEEFLEDARENPELGLLKSTPGYDEESSYFRLEAFKRFLKDRGSRFEEELLLDHIRHLGWKSGVKRFGPKTQRLWVKAVHRNGKAAGPAKEPDLFGGNGRPEPEKNPLHIAHEGPSQDEGHKK